MSRSILEGLFRCSGSNGPPKSERPATRPPPQTGGRAIKAGVTPAPIPYMGDLHSFPIPPPIREIQDGKLPRTNCDIPMPKVNPPKGGSNVVAPRPKYNPYENIESLRNKITILEILVESQSSYIEQLKKEIANNAK